MTLHFDKNVHQALDKIEFFDYHEIIVHEKEEERTHLNSCQIIETYGKAKWQIVDLLNQQYNTKFDLYNWLNKDKSDEVAYFLNESGSNCLNYSEFKSPTKFHLWLGKNGFIIGIEQNGKGFNAEEVYQKKIKENEGNGFQFFANCKSKVFFNNSNDAKIVFFKHNFQINNY
jgi:hypothetical protein